MPCTEERARMGKMCSDGSWEIPPLFDITVTFQNSNAAKQARMTASGVILFHHCQGSDWGKYSYRRDQCALILESKRRIKSPLQPLKYQRLHLLIGILSWLTSRQSYGIRPKETVLWRNLVLSALTFTGDWCSFRSAGISEEALLTVLAVTAFCVMAAVVTHASTPPSWCQPQPSTETAALGVSVTLALLV